MVSTKRVGVLVGTLMTHMGQAQYVRPSAVFRREARQLQQQCPLRPRPQVRAEVAPQRRSQLAQSAAALRLILRESQGALGQKAARLLWLGIQVGMRPRLGSPELLEARLRQLRGLWCPLAWGRAV